MQISTDTEKTVDENELLKIRKFVDDKKQEMTRKEGQLSELFNRLKTDFDFENIEEARTSLESMKEQLSNVTKQLSDGIVKLKEEFPQVDL